MVSGGDDRQAAALDGAVFSKVSESGEGEGGIVGEDSAALEAGGVCCEGDVRVGG